MKSLLSRIFANAPVEDLGSNRDGVLRLSLSGRFGNVRLLVTWVGAGWPADVQQAFNRLSASVLRDPSLVFAAQQMSPGAIQLLEEREINWADETGNARILAPGAVVLRSEPTRAAPTPTLSWSPSALAVAEALLAREWPEGVRTTELANLVQWSPGRVSSVLQRFDEEGWTVKYGPERGSGAAREVADASALLDAWAAATPAQESDLRTTHRTMRSPLRFLKSELAGILSEEVRWAISGWAASHELAPMSDAVPSLQIYVHADDFGQPLDRAIKNAGLRDVAEGGRVTFVRAHPSVLALSEPGPLGPIASTPRVYADLLEIGGRAEDAAVHLREELLDPRPTRGERGAAPTGLLAWERGCRERLEELARDRPELSRAYAQGTWSASYRLAGIGGRPSLSKLLAILREIRGHETGWPAWLTPDSGEDGPRPIDGAIECWFANTVFSDAAHADYWRADPSGRLCLIRGYQEDSSREEIASLPGELLDLTLPIWRTGECLLHASRLAHRLDATAVEMMMRWSGLRGRRLMAAVEPGLGMSPAGPAAEDEIVSYIELTAGEIDFDLAGAVRRLTEPLYENFGFFEPPDGVYEEQLAKMRRGGL